MEQIKYKRDYIFKVWASTILTAPILMMLLTAIIMAKEGDILDSGAFGFIAFSVGYGFALSLPTFLLIYFLFPHLSKKIHPTIHLKIILIVIGVGCILLTFYFLYGSNAYHPKENYVALTFSTTYSFCLTLFGLVVPIKTQKQHP